VHNAGAGGQRVRFLDREPVPPPLRGREAQLERETYRTAVVWIDGIRQRVPKAWLVEGSDTTAKASGRVARTAALSGSQVPATPALEEREPEPSPLSRPPVDDDAPITMEDWKALLDAYRKAGMRWGTSVQFIASTIGIPVGEVNPAQLTRRQYQQIMERLASFRPS